MKIAILQSNYIPWKGYFDLINMVDEFILFDDVQYTKNDWRNRNKIKTPQGIKWLSIPVFQNKLSQKIKETKAVNKIWRRKHWRSILQNYSKAPFFKEYKDMFEELYLNSDEEFLSQINYRFIIEINKLFGIKTKISWSSEYRIIDGKTERLIDICKQAKATEYISGPSAKKYIDKEVFKKENIRLKWMNYSGYPEYNQLYPPFEHGVSIIDLIFNEGPNATQYMKTFKKKR